jgi:DNA-binding PadR family transcriptional regulator
MLDLALLGVLEEGPQHGYELRKRLRNQLGHLANVSFGSIYPALSRLEKSGAVEAVEVVDQAPPLSLAPPTGSLTGERAAMRVRRRPVPLGRRSRKVYRITPAGRQFFLTLLTEASGDDARTFSLRWSLARHMEPEDRVALLERRRTHLRRQLGEISTQDVEQLDGYARSVAEHLAEGVERDLAWLDRLIEAEHATTGASATTTPRRAARRSA